MNGVCHIWGSKNDNFFQIFPFIGMFPASQSRVTSFSPVICVFWKCAMDSASFDLWVDSECEMGM